MWLKAKKNDPWIKRISAIVANFIRNKVSQENIKDTGAPLRHIGGNVFSESSCIMACIVFLPTLIKMEGFTVTKIFVNHYPRKYGKSKYGITNRAFRAFVDLLAVRWMKKRKLHYEVDND